MDWIEVIQLKSFTGSDRDAAMEAFRQVSAPVWEKYLKEISLFQNPVLDLELTILIVWSGEVSSNGKSRLGLQLADGFSEFGHIYHFGWRHSSKLIIRQQPAMPVQAQRHH